MHPKDAIYLMQGDKYIASFLDVMLFNYAWKQTTAARLKLIDLSTDLNLVSAHGLYCFLFFFAIHFYSHLIHFGSGKISFWLKRVLKCFGNNKKRCINDEFQITNDVNRIMVPVTPCFLGVYIGWLCWFSAFPLFAKCTNHKD